MHRGRLRVGAVRIAKPPEPRLADSARTLRAKSSTPAPEPRCYPAASTSDFARRPAPGAVASRIPSDRTADATDSERLLNVKTEQYVSVPSGTGKTHLLTGLAVAACRQKRRVRFASAAALINEMVEAKHQLQLGRALARWARYDLIALDEVGYVPLAEVGAEFLFQVIAERAEKAAVIVTTNLPFSEWTSVIPNARLCKALIDRITDRANIIDTGTESYRFRRTLEKRKGKAPDAKS